MKLNQAIAITTGEKTRKTRALTDLYHTLQKREFFDGHTKRYTPFEEDPTGASSLPNEDRIVQNTVPAMIQNAREILGDFLNVVAAQDIGNCLARADVVIDGTVVLPKVPVTHLLFLEKQLSDLRSFVESMPVLDSARTWRISPNPGQYCTEPEKSFRSRKVFRNHVKADATDKHPAQVEVYTEDVPVGTWETIRFSGAIPQEQKDRLLSRIHLMTNAIKSAREEANSIEIEKSTLGTSFLDYLFG